MSIYAAQKLDNSLIFLSKYVKLGWNFNTYTYTGCTWSIVAAQMLTTELLANIIKLVDIQFFENAIENCKTHTVAIGIHFLAIYCK